MSPRTAAPGARSRSTAEAQRAKIVARAVEVFSKSGYHGTPVSAVAEAAGVSPAYVFRLFPGKVALFAATVEHCYGLVRDALIAGSGKAEGGTPAEILDAMTDAYVDLIRDRDLIMLQVHAQSASDVTEIRDAVRAGIGTVVTAVSAESGADAASVQRFLAYGQLCHVIVLTDLYDVDEAWAKVVSDGIRHADPLATA